ncbi:hypothetical protein H1R17_01610 [Flavobacterium sp. xlx-214]|uniref:hypothetical protein n=1 Tax=unclassified Flavobacterium TaxID=196869 RepID=UPI0013D631C8|nr:MULTISPECIES: hypothetical protein [unclassified Flavobacterium]MBA5792718.1 hypothetical protein [Flavobacterium sp. xlx-221]QMI83861.1 hypothetical protein H1R17_01610 [Flavobacterium sp. xlx-214]
MKTKETRICIYPKDVMRITGKSYRQSLRMLHQIKKVYDKSAHQPISVTDFCSYTRLTQEEVIKFLD